MSLPVPAQQQPLKLDPRRIEALDAPLIALTQRCGGDLRQLLYAFFSFLNRRTDFYMVPPENDEEGGAAATMGFREGDAEKVLISAFRQFPLRRIPRKPAAAASPASSSGKATTTTQAKGSSDTAAPTSKTCGTTTSQSAVKSGEADNSRKSQEGTKANKGEETEGAAASSSTSTASKDVGSTGEVNKDNDNDNSHSYLEGVRYTEERLQIPVGNGGSTKRYKWTQTIEECSVLLAVPEGCRGKDLDVTIKPTSLTVKLKQKDKEPEHLLLDGTLSERVVPDESTWSLEGGALIVILYKHRKTFWKTIMVGDDMIDTTMVDARRHVGEYDEATQAQIRKIIYDQSQSRKKGGGTTTTLPTGDNKERIVLDTAKPDEIPTNLPPGVEYIDKKKIEDDDERKNKK